MNNADSAGDRFPLLTALLTQKGITGKGVYTNGDVAEVFGVSVRTIQDWCRSGKLRSRDLPGRARFLSEDLEALLQGSVRTRGLDVEP